MQCVVVVVVVVVVAVVAVVVVAVAVVFVAVALFGKAPSAGILGGVMAVTKSLQAWNSITATVLPCTPSGFSLNNCSAPQASHFLSWGCVDIDLPQRSLALTSFLAPPRSPHAPFSLPPISFYTSLDLQHVRGGSCSDSIFQINDCEEIKKRKRQNDCASGEGALVPQR
ncbi:hypothetical protein Q8A73_018606 [Channa argus]|nr:hypothetical protein Q8A73_018606 [Channa argus]